MIDRKIRRKISNEFKQEAVAFVTEQCYRYSKAAEALSIDEGDLRRWKKDIDSKANPNNLSQSEHDELKCLRREVKQLKMECFFDWQNQPEPPIDINELRLQARIKSLFEASRQSLGSRKMMKNLRKEGFKIGRYKTCRLMKKFGLKVKCKKRFVLTTDSKHSSPVAENLLGRQFNPDEPNQAEKST